MLSAGPTPHTPLDQWSFTIDGLVKSPVTWSWDAFQKLATQTYTVDISCVTKWTKLDTRWLGVSIDTLLEAVQVDPMGRFVMAYSDGGYTTNLPL
ncbi:MAG TPA: molybdopterin-dependent oxidoreductase, partial [Candidatus Dormibacteraeota bacterium]|nr:molybdopterin-dependent oxidoreductase [Candidatus Dormibacteraeota bacterium]